MSMLPALTSPLTAPLTSPMTARRGGGYTDIVSPLSLHPAVTFTRSTTGTYLGADGLLHTASINAPRYEYDAAGNYLGLLIEEARTNVNPKSVVNSSNYQCTNASIVDGAGTMPDGTPMALLREDTALTDHYSALNGSSIASAMTDNTDYTFSAFVKPAGRDYCQVNMRRKDSTYASAVFNLYSGTVVSQSNTTGAGIVPVGGGMYRVWVSRNVMSGAGSYWPGIVLHNGTSITYTGDGTSGILFGGIQEEKGSFPTSYIPTAGTTVTRAADIAAVSTLASIGYNAAEGAMFCEAESFGRVTGTYPPIWRLGVSSDLIDCFFSDTSTLGFDTRVAGVAQAATALAAPAGFSKLARAYKQSDSGYGLNGVSGAISGGTGLIPSVSALYIGRDELGSKSTNGHIKRLRYYPRRLSNADLQAITA